MFYKSFKGHKVFFSFYASEAEGLFGIIYRYNIMVKLD